MKFTAGLLFFAALAAASNAQVLNSGSESSVDILVGGEWLGTPVGWTDGVCYRPIPKVRVGDALEFRFEGGHNVWKLASREHYEACDFTDAIQLSDAGPSYKYTVTSQDATGTLGDGRLYFSCSVGSHCTTQKLVVELVPFVDIISERTPEDTPVSSAELGISPEECKKLQNGQGDDDSFVQNPASQSTCTDPVVQDDGYTFRSCLSGPATMTPGGVINNLFLVHYPYPTDRRVVVGQRTWEFVADVPGGEEPGSEGVTPVPVNQLYVHHLSGNVVLGQGNEGVRQSAPDAPFPEPYGWLTGDDGDVMIFHIIDLRTLGDNEWLPCLECRCRDENGTYLDIGGADETGGVNCCDNCTALTEPTIDYRMRYNVTYKDIEETPVHDVWMLTADISPAVGRNFEFDVPSFKYLPEVEQKQGNPYIQRLEREMPFKELFHMDFFGEKYNGPDTVNILRCVGHLHIAALGMWVEVVETGEVICEGNVTYGENVEQDKGFLTAISVDTFDPPKVIQADTVVRLVTEYNASIVHTGVMGMQFMFVAGPEVVTADMAQLQIPICLVEECDASLIPISDAAGEAALDEQQEETVSLQQSSSSSSCQDALPTHPACRFGNLCSCDVLVNAEESTGCGGVYTSQMGDLSVNEVCASYCDACEEISREELLQEELMMQLKAALEKTCEFATQACHDMLNNLYTCSSNPADVAELDTHVKIVLEKQGQALAMQAAKLGAASLHRKPVVEGGGRDGPVEIVACEGVTVNKFGSGATATAMSSWLSALLVAVVMMAPF